MKKILLLLLMPIIVFSSESVENVNEINIDEHLENLDRFFPDETYKGLFCDAKYYENEYNLLTVSIETNNVYQFLNYKVRKGISFHVTYIDNNKIDNCEKRVRENIIFVCNSYGRTSLIIDRTSLTWGHDGSSEKNYQQCVIVSKEEMQQKASELVSLIKENQKEFDYREQRELDRRKL